MSSIFLTTWCLLFLGTPSFRVDCVYSLVYLIAWWALTFAVFTIWCSFFLGCLESYMFLSAWLSLPFRTTFTLVPFTHGLLLFVRGTYSLVLIVLCLSYILHTSYFMIIFTLLYHLYFSAPYPLFVFILSMLLLP